MNNLTEVDWSKIPPPEDDGSANHLVGSTLPTLKLPGTGGESIDVSTIDGLAVIYAYPMTGSPDIALPEGWDMLPGARGCTPQSCAFRDHADDLTRLGVSHVYGLSTQSTEYQKEAVERLHLPFVILSDAEFELQKALNLPTMKVNDMTLLKRLTMIVENAKIKHVFYPVFPPDRNAIDVLNWLESQH